MKMKEIMPKADKPVSLQRLGTGVAAHPPFSFDLIIDDFIQALNCLWSRRCFAPGCSWVDIDDNKIPHCSDKLNVHRWQTQPTKDKKTEACYAYNDISLDWLDNLALSTKYDVQINGYDDKCSQ